jgi:hypothetical protein
MYREKDTTERGKIQPNPAGRIGGPMHLLRHGLLALLLLGSAVVTLIWAVRDAWSARWGSPAHVRSLYVLVALIIAYLVVVHLGWDFARVGEPID